jgi:hypothetical protein
VLLDEGQGDVGDFPPPWSMVRNAPGPIFTISVTPGCASAL